jgi:hypothetical protein
VKRYTLLLCLIRRMRVRTRDDAAEMFVKRMGKIHRQARELRRHCHVGRKKQGCGRPLSYSARRRAAGDRLAYWLTELSRQ